MKSETDSTVSGRNFKGDEKRFRIHQKISYLPSASASKK